MRRQEWVAADYMDDGRWGILNRNNEIVVGAGLGLARSTCEAIARAHNIDLRWALDGVRMAGARTQDG